MKLDNKILNVLLINVHSCFNAGDAALTEVALKQLYEHFPGSQITLVMNDPQSYLGDEQTVVSFLTWVYRHGRRQAMRFLWLILISFVLVLAYRLFRRVIILPIHKELYKTLQAFLDADFVVGAPGGYFFSYGSGNALIVLIYTMALAILSGKPLYLLPQSIGPFNHRRERLLARWLLPRARVVMLREEVSLDNLAAYGFPISNCHLLPDMAFAFEGDTQISAQEWLRSQGVDPRPNRPMLGVTVVDWEAQYPGFDKQEQYEVAIAATIRHFAQVYNGVVFFFPQSWGPTPMEDDRLPARRVANRVSDLGSSVLVVESPLLPSLLKAVFGEMDIFIGTRMHSNIFAMSQGVPLIAIGYLHKTLGIARTAGIERWVIGIDHIDDELLIERLTHLWAERDQVRAHLEKSTQTLAQGSRQAGNILANDFASLKKGISHG